MISPLAFVHPKAELGSNVVVEPFAMIHQDTVIGDGCHIMSHAVIMPKTRMGKNNRVFPHAVVGAIPQDLKFKGEESLVEIGDDNTIRECVTINRGTLDRMTTKIGNNCLLMAYVHLGHDVIVGNHVIIANCAQIAGHITIEDYAVLEGKVAAQQFVNIGKHAFVAGASLVRKSVPPYVRVAKEPLQYIGINSVGLGRRGFSQEKIRHIEDIYRIIFIREKNMSVALERVEKEIPDSDEKKEILNFIRNQKDGIVRGV
ncbi:MAG: acyl-ACP--UDP-N-acetylglucosamine O-acyltransferase [Bacteroidia bacterium]|nr:acyl-ACP--UDP-N-acetylglucosamine O-acyltransferase [Bacteroidia bacterium]